MDTIKKLSDYAIVKGHDQKFLGVPKTIDNDLALMDHTPGFGSAAKYIAASTKEVIRDAMGLSYKRKMITIMEIMGRNAGWLTGATALAKTEDCCGPDLIYLPEIPFDVDRFLKKCSDLLEKKPSIVIAVSEGIKVPDGRYVCQLAGGSDYVDAFGHRQLAGTAGYLASFLAAKTGCKTRAVELSTLQRSASHMASRVDINEAFMVGGAAVKAADEGDSGRMVVIDRVSDDPYMSAAGIYDVHKIANNEKLVPRSWVNREGNYVTREFIDYVEPLIQGDYQGHFMVNGLPPASGAETVGKYETVEKMGSFHRNGRMPGSWFGISVYSVPTRFMDAGKRFCTVKRTGALQERMERRIIKCRSAARTGLHGLSFLLMKQRSFMKSDGILITPEGRFLKTGLWFSRGKPIWWEIPGF